MIDLYYWPTPNGKKVSVMLEECGLAYNAIAVNIGRGDQFTGEFLDISPNNRIPAIVDHDPEISLFESGAILMYLAEKSGKFMPQEMNERYEALQWLFWQMAGLGPMAGQLSHFVNYAPDPVPYAHTRYEQEYLSPGWRGTSDLAQASMRFQIFAAGSMRSRRGRQSAKAWTWVTIGASRPTSQMRKHGRYCLARLQNRLRKRGRTE
jgi:glutathione S-transferase